MVALKLWNFNVTSAAAISRRAAPNPATAATKKPSMGLKKTLDFPNKSPKINARFSFLHCHCHVASFHEQVSGEQSQGDVVQVGQEFWKITFFCGENDSRSKAKFLTDCRQVDDLLLPLLPRALPLNVKVSLAAVVEGQSLKKGNITCSKKNHQPSTLAFPIWTSLTLTWAERLRSANLALESMFLCSPGMLRWLLR